MVPYDSNLGCWKTGYEGPRSIQNGRADSIVTSWDGRESWDDDWGCHFCYWCAAAIGTLTVGASRLGDMQHSVFLLVCRLDGVDFFEEETQEYPQ